RRNLLHVPPDGITTLVRAGRSGIGDKNRLGMAKRTARKRMKFFCLRRTALLAASTPGIAAPVCMDTIQNGRQGPIVNIRNEDLGSFDGEPYPRGIAVGLPGKGEAFYPLQLHPANFVPA